MAYDRRKSFLYFNLDDKIDLQGEGMIRLLIWNGNPPLALILQFTLVFLVIFELGAFFFLFGQGILPYNNICPMDEIGLKALGGLDPLKVFESLLLPIYLYFSMSFWFKSHR